MAGKYVSKYSGKEIDEAIEKVYKDKELSPSQIMDSTAEKPVDVNNLTGQEGKYTIYFADGIPESSVSSPGTPIELEVFKDPTGNLTHRFEQNGVTMERSYNEATDTWSEWKPVLPFTEIGDTEVLNVTKDTLVFRSVANASEIQPATPVTTTP